MPECKHEPMFYLPTQPGVFSSTLWLRGEDHALRWKCSKCGAWSITYVKAPQHWHESYGDAVRFAT
jgi:hypothetical protein